MLVASILERASSSCPSWFSQVTSSFDQALPWLQLPQGDVLPVPSPG